MAPVQKCRLAEVLCRARRIESPADALFVPRWASQLAEPDDGGATWGGQVEVVVNPDYVRGRPLGPQSLTQPLPRLSLLASASGLS